MSKGVNVELDELIALKRYAQKRNIFSKNMALRPGNHTSKMRGRGMDFAEARNYQAGDEIRHMEWRVTARTGRPHVKLYQEERERPVMIVTDFNPSMYFGTRLAFKSVVAAKLAALIAWTAIKHGDKVGGLVFSAKTHNEYTPRSRESGVLPFLGALSQYTHTMVNNGAKPRPLSEMLIRLRRVTRPGSIVVLISDFYQLDKESEQHLSRLRAHNDILTYQICDPLELNPPKPQCYAITNGEEEVLLDTSDPYVAQAYQNYCQQKIAKLQAQFNALQIQYVQLTAEVDLAKLVWQTFPRRRRD